MNGTRYFPPLGLRAGCGRQKGDLVPSELRLRKRKKE